MSLLTRLPRIRFASEPREASPAATYYMILVSALVLGGFGLLMSFSASAVSTIADDLNPYVSFLRSLLIILASAAVAAVAMFFPSGWWKRLAPPIFFASVLLQLSVLWWGIEQGGNLNWVRIPGINQTFQPSEFLKLGTCLILALVLSNLGSAITNWKRVVFAAGVPAAVAIGAVMVGHDMGTALVFVAITIGALWIAGAPGKWFPIVGLVLVGGAAALVMASSSRTRRVLAALPGNRPDPDPSNPTQPDHGLWALGSGGLVGVGPGASREKWDYLQEANTDFILAIVGEEFGLLGTLTLLVALGVLVWGTLRLASNADSAFVRIASGAIGSWIAFQGLLNIGTVTGLAPVIGVPFPLVSHGGSAYLFTALSVGVLLSFARSEAGIKWRTRMDVETRGRDPRVAPKRRRTRRKK